MPGHDSGPDRRIEADQQRQQAREALRRQVGIWLSRAVPNHTQHSSAPSGRPRI